MSKLIPMEEAANILGMTVEQITELRSNHEIFGYRDGQNWKFKMTELERVAGELDIKLNVSGAVEKVAGDLSDSFAFSLDDSVDDLILDDDVSGSAEFVEEDASAGLSEKPLKEELQIAADSKSIDLEDDDDAIELHDSGILKIDSVKDLGLKEDSGLSLENSGHLNLEDSGMLNLEDSGMLNLEDSGELLPSKSDVLDDDEKLSVGGSSLSLASDSNKLLGGDPAGTGSDLLDDEIEKSPSGSDTGKMLGSSGGDDSLFTEELSLADSFKGSDSFEDSGSFEDSAELVLDDSSAQLMLEDSGIDLSVSDSGIVLGDEPLELGGSDIDALELPEDDDMIVLEDAADPDSATIMQEDDFNLTPLEASMEEDDSSGSQVIALEDSEIYADESAPTMLGGEGFPSQPGMFDESMGLDGGGMMPTYDDTMGGAMIGGAMAPAGMHTGPAAMPEAPYTVYQVISLGLVTALLMTGGMVAFNLAQNMWMPQDQVIGSSVLNFFLKLTGMN